jgi:hypothetical protein
MRSRRLLLIWWFGAVEKSVVCGVRGGAPPGRQELPCVCLGYLQQLGDLLHSATGSVHLPHRDGLLLADPVNVVLGDRADLLYSLF